MPSDSSSTTATPGFVHFLEAAVLFGVLGGIIDAARIISLQSSIAGDSLTSLRLLDSAAFLTILAFIPGLLIAWILIRLLAQMRNWPLRLSLALIYFIASIPAGIMVALSIARLANPDTSELPDLQAMYEILKYSWIILPVGWGVSVWLALSRVSLRATQVHGRFTAFVTAFTGYVLIVPLLLDRFGGIGEGGLSNAEYILITLGTFIIAVVLLPLIAWIASIIARPARGAVLGLIWIAAIVIPFLPALIAGPSMVGTPPTGDELIGRDANVLLVSIDTQRKDDLECYEGYARTPNIVSLSAECAIFENAVTPMPVTGPGHMSMLTGLQPEDGIGHGVRTNGIQLPENTPTLATILNDAGYRTAGIIGGSPLSRGASGLQRGFNYYNDIFDRSILARIFPREIYTLIVVRAYRKFITREILRAEWVTKPADRVTDEAIDWLDENSDEPFFMFVHYYDPHSPLEPPPPYDEMYSIDPASPGTNFMDRYPVASEAEARYSDEALASRRSLYRGEVSFVDTQFGRLIDRLTESGLTDETLIIVTADHGEGFSPHYIGHINRLYDPIVNVPLLIRDPDSVDDGLTGRRHENLVNISDIYSTALSFLEIESPYDISELHESVPGAGAEWDRNLLDIVRSGLEIDPDTAEGYTMPSLSWDFIPMISYGVPTEGEADVGRIYGFRLEDSKLLYAPEAEGYLSLYRYFDLDFGESTNRYGSVDWSSFELPDAPEVLKSWASVQQDDVTKSMDPLVRAQLRALGYVQ